VNPEDELFDALRSAHFTEIVEDRELARRSRTTARRIRQLERRDRWRERRRWWLALVAGCAVVFAGVGVADGGLLHDEPVQQEVVWCYRYVPEDLTDDSARFGLALLGSEETTAQNALDLCYSNGDGTMAQIPDPVSQCILHDGSVAVIPIARCVDLGLPESEVRQPTSE
jgi:hypothetical protein